ncbi:MAG: thiamine pyrophosphate-binding protein [Pseudomonadota bacterium]
MTGGELLVRCLSAQGVTAAFGVPGESYLAVLDALYDVQNSLRLITTRHESGASFAAEAWGKLKGEPGVCFVTRGPGATNASIGIHTAMQDSTPMVMFVGQIARDMRDREAFQEIDYRAFFGPIAKWATEIDNADRIPEVVARAFQTAMTGRPGPVVVALPEDMLTDMTEAEPCGPWVPVVPQPDPAAISQAAAVLSDAQSPLLIVGGGGWDDASRAALKAFVSSTNIPTATAFRSQDLLDNRAPQFLGDAGAGMFAHLKEAIRQADVILALNIRFGEMVTDGWTLMAAPNPRQRIIHSHISDRELGKIYQPEVAIQGAPGAVLQALLTEVTGDWSSALDPLRARYEATLTPAPAKGALDMATVCAHLREKLPDDTIVTNGAGNFAIWSGRYLQYHGKMRLLGPQSGAMGAGVPAALAAKAADPARPVVCFAGDGDFQMSVGELGTALQWNLRPVILIVNNGLYGTIRLHQARRYAGRQSGTEIVNPDFVAVAKGYGFYGEQVTRSEDFPAAFARAMASPTGAVLDLVVDPNDIAPNLILDE